MHFISETLFGGITVIVGNDGGHQYWVMRDGEDNPTTVLNRCDLSQYKISITWKGADG